MMLTDKNILITGGTGSFGKKCTEIILKKYKPKMKISTVMGAWPQFIKAATISRAIAEHNRKGASPAT